MEGVRNSTATRIVVAHRISTIRGPTASMCSTPGKSFRFGGLDELADADGPFSRLGTPATVVTPKGHRKANRDSIVSNGRYPAAG